MSNTFSCVSISPSAIAVLVAAVVVSSDSSLIVSQACDGGGEVEEFLPASLSLFWLHLKATVRSVCLVTLVAQKALQNCHLHVLLLMQGC